MKILIGICLVCLPLKHLKINSDFGYRIHPLTGRNAMHEGIDLKARHDTVFAVIDGLVESAGYNDKLGINLILAHGPVGTVYGHLSKILVGAHESVTAGEPIAITGATGRVTAEHLHFAVRYRNQYINPVKFLFEMLKTQENEQNF